MQAIFSILTITLFISVPVLAQELVPYKIVGQDTLFLEVHLAEPMADTIQSKGVSIVFFFGGGWNGGNRHHFLNHARYFSQRGLSCFLADYRTKSQHQTTPFESLKDARSAMRFVRQNAARWNLNPDKIIAAGGSAGGHLAAATALVDAYNEESDDLEVSTVPSALVLFNPVLDNGPGGYGYERIQEAYHQFSPLHNLAEGAPPTIIFLGTDDKLIPVETAQYYQAIMQRLGSRCDLQLYADQGHGFFNYRNFEYYQKTILAADHFLQSLGLLDQQPIVPIE